MTIEFKSQEQRQLPCKYNTDNSRKSVIFEQERLKTILIVVLMLYLLCFCLYVIGFTSYLARGVQIQHNNKRIDVWLISFIQVVASLTMMITLSY